MEADTIQRDISGRGPVGLAAFPETVNRESAVGEKQANAEPINPLDPMTKILLAMPRFRGRS